ncbi:MAG: Mur ligase family protein, partial [Clostridia bacterium]
MKKRRKTSLFSLDRGDWFFIILLLFVSLLMARPYIYTIQQDNYRLMTLLKSRRMKAMFAFDMLAVAVFLLVWAIIYFLHARAFWGYITTMFFFVTELALYFLEDLPDKKKPLRYTKRAVRGIISVALFATAATSCAFAFCNANVADIYMRYLVFFAFPIAFPLMFVAVIAFINIFERLNNLRYEMRASRELTKNKNLIKIGITGSYGKTSVKNILAEMLKKDFNVLATPSSFNTPMGIAKTVKSLDATHEVFIAEMGARHTGDIKKLMKIVKPTHTILTGINNQHLETFKTEENIAREKFCVVNMLNSEGGFAVVTDKQRTRFNALINKKHNVKVPIFVGFDTDSDVTIKNFNVTTRGSIFTLTLDGTEYVAETELLG